MMVVLIKSFLFSGPKLPIGLIVVLISGIYFTQNLKWSIEARARLNAAIAEYVDEAHYAAKEAQIKSLKKTNADMKITANANSRIIKSQLQITIEQAAKLSDKSKELELGNAKIDELLDGAAICPPPAGLFNKLRDQ